MSLQSFKPWLFLLILLCSATSWAAPTVHTITVGGGANVFTPKTLTINVGDTVIWTNGGGFHNVVADDNSFDNGAPSGSAWTFSQTFTKAGSVPFYCSEHGAPGGIGMSGVLTVNDVAPPPPTIKLGGYLSGNWYDSSQSGHGFQLELTSTNNAMDAIWFVYTPDGDVGSSGTGGQNWIYSQGTWDPTSNTVTLPAFLLNGAKFPFPASQFVASDVKNTSWGTLTFTFTDCNTGTVSWNSTIAAYGTGTLPISRLTQIAGTTCPSQ